MKESEYLQGEDDLISRFKLIPFLRSFQNDYLQKIISASKLRQYDAGETIFKEGTYEQWVYILLTGSVIITNQGKQLAILNQKGDMFGEMAVITKDLRSATVQAQTNTTCLAINISSLDDLKEEERITVFFIIYRLFAFMLSERLRKADDEIAHLRSEIAKLKADLNLPS